MNYRIETIYTLLSPLSHIGESESTQSFLNTIQIMTQEGINDCFAYTGNAIRGQLRDSGARYLLNKLGGIKVPLKTFHLLFSGGSIGGTQSADIEQAKAIRAAMPLVSLLGGGVGNQILEGKLSMTFAYPVCKETKAIIPASLSEIDYAAQASSWKKMTGEISLTRRDDSKYNDGIEFIYKENALLETESKKSEKAEPATQMRYSVEYMIPGTQLYHVADLSCTELELGAYVSCIHEWAKRPILGGMSGKGFGQVSAKMMITIDGKRQSFLDVAGNQLIMTEEADKAKSEYDKHLERLYDGYIETGKAKFVQLLEG